MDIHIFNSGRLTFRPCNLQSPEKHILVQGQTPVKRCFKNLKKTVCTSLSMPGVHRPCMVPGHPWMQQVSRIAHQGVVSSILIPINHCEMLGATGCEAPQCIHCLLKTGREQMYIVLYMLRSTRALRIDTIVSLSQKVAIK